ncbi:hypothetical protein HDC90_003810 [Pedobacter sp. AK013]|nr:hypothetical protein [Pedobacter sp. AK013]
MATAIYSDYKTNVFLLPASKIILQVNFQLVEVLLLVLLSGVDMVD